MNPIGYSTTDARSPWERPVLASGIISALVQLAAFGYFAVAAAPHMPPLVVTYEDLAVAPEAWLPNLDTSLLGVLRRMRQVCVVISCWNQYARTTEIARAAAFHLALLKRATGTSTCAIRGA